MILPIVAYGNQVLRKIGSPISKDYENLNGLIENMWETMYNANGVGLAAPQINASIRLFVVDTLQVFEDLDQEDEEKFKGQTGLKKAFLNAQILEKNGEPYNYNEGCLSIPGIREDVMREESITIKYMDENFEEHTETYNGLNARVILHEYDHIEGKLFIDYVNPLKKKLMKKKLENISKGQAKVSYRMILPK